MNAAYYAMLYAARAALSERDEHAKTHRGTWHLFREQFVVNREVEELHLRAAQRAQGLREGGDYEAREPSIPEAGWCSLTLRSSSPRSLTCSRSRS